MIPSTLSDEAHEVAFDQEDYEHSLSDDYDSFEEDDISSEGSIEQADREHCIRISVEEAIKSTKSPKIRLQARDDHRRPGRIKRGFRKTLGTSEVEKLSAKT
ncbi:hypothetical protein DID88_008047 [Monilinia fructigena]|uniref:Uncharacterized protein n=1 Tax=Monilinia fructigena TaxID=38457 RepID=A0A395J6J3_9HELO|nr:hypothetical protein DID88_008047 [Monilinia fructigena]